MPKFEGAKEISEAEKERSLKAIDKKTGGATKLAQDFRAKLDDVGRRVNRPEKIVQPRCRVCQHENRDYIDGQLAAADVNLSQLARKLPPLEDGKRINRRSLASHAKNHLNTEQGVLREIMIFEAERAGKSWEESVTGAFTHRGLMEIMLRQAFDNINRGVVQVEPKDTLAIVKLVREMDEQSSSEAVDEARATVNAFIQAIMQHVDRETWVRIANTTEKIMKGSGIELSLIADADVVEAEAVDLESSQEQRLREIEQEVASAREPTNV